MKSEPIEKNGPLKALGRAISKSLSYLKVFIVLVALIFGLILVKDEFAGEKVVIDLIELPKALSDQVITNVAVTRQLVDAAVTFAYQGYNSKYVGNYPLKRLPRRPEDYEYAKPDPKTNPRDVAADLFSRPESLLELELSAISGLRDIKSFGDLLSVLITDAGKEPLMLSGSKQEPDIQLPTIGSIRGFLRYFKKTLWKPTDVHITGEITIQKERKNPIRLVLRSSTSSALQPTSIQEGRYIDEVIKNSGKVLLKLAYPCIAASSYYQMETGTENFAKISQLIESCRKDRKDYKYIADLLSALISYEENPRRPEKAYKLFEAAVDSAPDKQKKGNVYLNWGKILVRDNKPEQAKEMFNKVKEADPDDLRAYIELAIIETEKSGVASAHDQLQEVWRRHPQKKPEFHVAFGNWLLDNRKPNDAIKEYEKAIALKKNHVVAHNNLGIALYNLGNYAEAIEAYKSAIRFDRAFNPAYFNWGIALNRLGEKDETKMLDLIRQYKLALKENSGSNIGYFLSGVAYLKNEKLQAAINDFKEYENRETIIKSPVFYSLWGDALVQWAQHESSYVAGYTLRRKAIRKYEKAIGKYEKALEIDNNYHLAYSKWGDALLQWAQHEYTYKAGDTLRREAIRKYEKALEIDNNYHRAYYKLSIAYYILGEKRLPFYIDKQKWGRPVVKNLIDKGDEYYKKWEAASKQYRLKPDHKSGLTSELVSQLEPPLPQRPDRSGSGVGRFRRFLPWAAALVALLAGGLVIVIYSSKGKLRERLGLGPTTTPPPVPSEIPSEKSTSPEAEDVSSDEVISSTPQRNKQAQVGGFPASSPDRPAAILLGITGRLRGWQFLVEKEICRIGADRKNDLSIPDDDYVSGKHAQLRYEYGNLYIFDTGPQKGTFVNGECVLQTGRILFSGDRIQVGNTIFEVLAT